VAVISIAAMACAPPEVGDRSAHTPIQQGRVYSALSSADSRSELGISRWHFTVESLSGRTTAGTLDGQSGNGKVKFLTTVRFDKKSSTLHLEAILPQSGEWVWDTKQGTALLDTIPANSRVFSKAFSADWGRAHSASSMTAYRGGKAGAPRRTPDWNDQNNQDGFQNWGLWAGHELGLITDSKYDAATKPDYDPKNYDADGKRIPDTPNASDGKDANPKDATTDGAGKDPEQSPASTDSTQDSQEPASTELPPDNNAGNLDDAANKESSDEQKSAEETNDDESNQSDSRGNDSGDFEDDSDFSGGDDSAEASNVCKAVAMSTTTGIRACLHY
jgi:hypothetical protein